MQSSATGDEILRTLERRRFDDRLATVPQQGRNARAWLGEHANVAPGHVGLIGFCFGGGFALTAGAGWAAVSANYAHLHRPEAMRGFFDRHLGASTGG